MISSEDLELIMEALEVVNQVDGLGFSEEQRDRSIELIEVLGEQPNELDFD